ncbi:MAG: galactose mutarotase [Lachnospiraceae bacterium]|nr:galactose mutarotase [Lachnospiraceae bacterium]
MNAVSFGRCPAGEVREITLSDGVGIRAKILTLGATLRSLFVPGRDGRPVDVVLGYDSAQEYYDGGNYFGASVGRNGNRIADAELPLNGCIWPLTANEGRHQLHGGRDGFSHRLWDVEADEKKAVFTLVSPHLDQGFPGTMTVQVCYSLETAGELSITYRAVSDRDTVFNMTNHAYFNLSGHDSGPADGHLLSLAADAYTEVRPDLIPTGRILPVAGTDFDLRAPTPVGEVRTRPALLATGGLDHNFVLRGTQPAAVLESPRSGIVLETLTDQPGLQVYMAGSLTACQGKNGARYDRHHAVCLETQHFPDAVHHADFPSTILRAGETGVTRTVYRFKRR